MSTKSVALFICLISTLWSSSVCLAGSHTDFTETVFTTEESIPSASTSNESHTTLTSLIDKPIELSSTHSDSSSNQSNNLLTSLSNDPNGHISAVYSATTSNQTDSSLISISMSLAENISTTFSASTSNEPSSSSISRDNITKATPTANSTSNTSTSSSASSFTDSKATSTAHSASAIYSSPYLPSTSLNPLSSEVISTTYSASVSHKASTPPTDRLTIPLTSSSNHVDISTVISVSGISNTFSSITSSHLSNPNPSAAKTSTEPPSSAIIDTQNTTLSKSTIVVTSDSTIIHTTTAAKPTTTHVSAAAILTSYVTLYLTFVTSFFYLDNIDQL